jgi:hypothetical protein
MRTARASSDPAGGVVLLVGTKVNEMLEERR